MKCPKCEQSWDSCFVDACLTCKRCSLELDKRCKLPEWVCRKCDGQTEWRTLDWTEKKGTFWVTYKVKYHSYTDQCREGKDWCA